MKNENDKLTVLDWFLVVLGIVFFVCFVISVVYITFPIYFKLVEILVEKTRWIEEFWIDILKG